MNTYEAFTDELEKIALSKSDILWQRQRSSGKSNKSLPHRKIAARFHMEEAAKARTKTAALSARQKALIGLGLSGAIGAGSAVHDRNLTTGLHEARARAAHAKVNPTAFRHMSPDSRTQRQNDWKNTAFPHNLFPYR